jgi:uncharacterized protein YndB with AHSA1/START domain
MKSLKQMYQINAPIEKVWDALVNPEIIEQWGGGPATMNAEEGSEFKLWGGDIYGTNTEIKPKQLLKQDWYQDGWAKPSKVTFELKENGDVTEVYLEHTDIPADDFPGIETGWPDYYMGPLQILLEEKDGN